MSGALGTISAVHDHLASVWLRAERAIDPCFPIGANPMAHLGAIACLLLVLLLISGTYLYAVFDTSVAGAFASIDSLMQSRLHPGGWLRSAHRYAADAFMLVTLLHLLREAVLGHYRRFRAVTWLTGVPLLLFLYISGIGGFWLNWDRLGQYGALASAEILDALPLGSVMTRNFIDPSALGDRFFSLLIFVHLGVPLLLLFALWFHLQRITRPRFWPPRSIAIGLSCAILVLAIIVPVASQGPADLRSVPTGLEFDWLLLHPLAIADVGSPWVLWSLVATALLGLLLLPLRQRLAKPVAVVDADNCNGCRRCVNDCPYAAITLQPHPNGRPDTQIAVVDAQRCASCGICAGACPSATPFRSNLVLANGIEMPQQPIDQLRRELQQALSLLDGASKVVVFGCTHGAELAPMASTHVAPIPVLCIGMLPPSFIEYALRSGAQGVVVSGCAVGGCEFRLGNAIVAERLLGLREPRLRASVSTDRYRYVSASAGQHVRITEAIDSLRELPRNRSCA